MPSNSENSPNTSRPTYRTSLTHSLPQLESLALDALNGAFPKGVTIPVDVDFLAEAHLGLQILAVRGLESSFGVYGVFRKWPKGHFDLVIDEDIMDRRLNLYRFTIGEEIAHYVLHRHHFATARTIEDACKVYVELREHHEGIDRNARWFSSALLMPCSHIKTVAAHYYPEMVQVAGFSNPEAVLSTLTSRLAKKFCVSRESMRYRLQKFPCKVYDAARAALAEKRSNLW
jgi:hypothetical protein